MEHCDTALEIQHYACRNSANIEVHYLSHSPRTRWWVRLFTFIFGDLFQHSKYVKWTDACRITLQNHLFNFARQKAFHYRGIGSADF